MKRKRYKRTNLAFQRIYQPDSIVRERKNGLVSPLQSSFISPVPINSIRYSLHIDEGQPHWYDNVFKSTDIQTFLDQYTVLSPTETEKGDVSDFVLTVADPSRSGSLHGWSITKLCTPGRSVLNEKYRPLITSNTSCTSQAWKTLCSKTK